MADIFELFKKINSGAKKDFGPPEYIVVGLGNPGGEYARTRHNAGFLALDYISQKCGCDIKELKFKALVGNAALSSHRVLLVKPQTYMNNSGEAVKAALSFYKLTPDKLIVISDDIAQPVGRMRIRKSGSDGGQKGLRSIITHLDTDEFPRIRIGVGEKPNPEYPLADWVLGKIPKEDEEKIFKILECTYDALLMLIDEKTDDAMGKFNGVKF